MAQAFADIDEQAHGAKTKLERLAALFQNDLDAGNRMCLCGMLAAECSTLDPGSRAELCGSLNDDEIWPARVLTRARKEGELIFTDKPRDETRFLLSSHEGVILIARAYEDSEHFETAVQRLLSKLASPARRARNDSWRFQFLHSARFLLAVLCHCASLKWRSKAQLRRLLSCF